MDSFYCYNRRASFHSAVEEALGLEKNTMLLGTAFAVAGTALFMQRKQQSWKNEELIGGHWHSLFFCLHQ